MPGVERLGDAATCGDVNTGCTTVFANGIPITRVGADTAGGTILGPGSFNTYVEGAKISLPNDAIIAHYPSPTPGTHFAALTNPVGSPTVFAGVGSAGGGASEGAKENPDLRTTLFMSIDVSANNVPCFPTNDQLNCGTNPANKYIGDLPYMYSLTNMGDAPTEGPFTIGIWEVPNGFAGSGIFPREAEGVIDGTYPKLVKELRITEIIDAGDSYSNTFGISNPDGLLVNTMRTFNMYLDIDNEIGEASDPENEQAAENNAFPSTFTLVIPQVCPPCDV